MPTARRPDAFEVVRPRVNRSERARTPSGCSSIHHHPIPDRRAIRVPVVDRHEQAVCGRATRPGPRTIPGSPGRNSRRMTAVRHSVRLSRTLVEAVAVSRRRGRCSSRVGMTPMGEPVRRRAPVGKELPLTRVQVRRVHQGLTPRWTAGAAPRHAPQEWRRQMSQPKESSLVFPSVALLAAKLVPWKRNH
jgi:hypothetical protein